MSQFSLFPETKIPDEERSVCGGIYKYIGQPNSEVTEWSIAWGRDCVCTIFDGISHIEEEVEFGGLHNLELVKGYGLCLKLKPNKEGKYLWQIRDSGKKGQSDYIIGQGEYLPGFYESLKPYKKLFMK